MSLPHDKGSFESWVLGAWYGGAARTLAQRVFTGVLAPLGWVVARVARRRRKRALSSSASVQFTPPVVVVGNLTVGGTGKTPVVAWLAAQLQARGKWVGLVSRGYGRSGAKAQRVAPGDSAAVVGDEPAWLAATTGCPVAVGHDRHAAAQLLGAEVDVVLSDDGLQHHALPRRLEIIVVDATRAEPFGNGRCLPAGPLREQPDFIGPGHVVLFNHGAVPAAQFATAAVPEWASAAMTLHFAVRPQHAVNLVTGERQPLAAFAGATSIAAMSGSGGAVAVAGIGHPERFFRAVQAAGAGVQQCVAFPDHHRYVASDLASFADRPVLMTAKDAVKCAAFAAPNWWRVDAALEFAPGEGERLVRAVLAAMA